ncbi:valine--tRNA ligase [Patescibacteria group bacterium]|nr:valine--tRNA ligase [Patescibacteria group bacterium]
MKELSSAYNPKETEQPIYKKWLDSGFFNPDKLPGNRKQPYTIVLPPPNVTGTLHLGHALMLVIQDILIRYHRMRGYKTLWLPGTDHAAIATQSKVEAMLYKEQEKTRHDLGREDFLKMVYEYAEQSRKTIVEQTKRMGASVDWDREAFTLDEPRNFAVRTAFKKMYDSGLIYQGKRLVNWDPKLQTTVSDDEIEWKDEITPLYYLKYGPFTIATARPETKFGDKYVVVHPDDKRYAKYKDGEKIELEWINGPVTATIIKDDAIDMAFGTGAMTITPWHDAADNEIAQKHKLDYEQIIDLKGKLLPVSGEFAGLHIKKARPLIIEKLTQKGLVEKIDEKYAHRIATNSRGGGIIEPQIMKQWFVDVNKEFHLSDGSRFKTIKPGAKITLRKLMRDVVESDEIKIVPEHFTKTYFHWIDNLRDWCISRQIWYGHRIPVWYKGNEIYCDIEPPKGEGWEQDPDTLDTWFSSGLWTFSTLGWPDKTNDLALFHPTSVLETGYDILFFWVARMILMTGYLLEDIPFSTVYLHGLVRDQDRQKMSKSKGNIIDPIDMIDKYGTDALRMALIFSTAAGNDIPLAEDKIKGMKHFANKLWNIARFVLANVDEFKDIHESKETGATSADTDILNKLAETTGSVKENLDKLKLNEAAQEIYQFVWHEFADIYIEASKEQMKDPDKSENTKKILAQVLLQSLKLLHPFMPFITEEIWSKLDQPELLIITDLR